MSEYQFYEFKAIDHALTEAQVTALGRYSTRAQITPTRFVNEYNYGSFRGDPFDFLSQYFDAMVYVANWGTRRFMFRIPKALLDVKRVKLYCPGPPTETRTAGDNVIFDFTCEDEEGGGWEEGAGWMTRLSPLRAELINGDHRVLYLAWLLGLQAGEVDDGAQEPPVPAGLATLSRPQAAFVEFMRLDKDLIAAAAERSLKPQPHDAGLAAAIAALPNSEKENLLLAFIGGQDPHLGPKLRQRFRESSAHRGGASSVPARTVGDLRKIAADLEAQREEALARREDEQRARRKAREAADRAVRLAELAGRQEQAWGEVEQLIGARQTKSYEQAVAIVGDLREVAVRAQTLDSFRRRITELRARHGKKKALQEKLGHLNLT